MVWTLLLTHRFAASCHAGHPRVIACRRLPIFALALLLSTAGCASSSALRKGVEAEDRQDYDVAVVEYNNAVRLHPDDANARLGLDRAKLRAAGEHFQRGRRQAALGKYDQALVEYEVASELNPGSGDIDAALRATRNQLRSNAAVAREGKTPLQTLIEASRDFPTPGLDLPPDAKMPASLIFREASSRDVFLAIAKFADISLAFDPAFREAPVTVDLRNATLDDALSSITGLTRTFFRVTAPRTVLVIPDTPAKRREYEEEVVRTLYVSNADLKETMDLLRMVLDARRISPTTGINALTIKDTPERITAAARLLSAIDKARPEVIIDVELLEVDRTRLKEYGLQLASPTTSPPIGIDGTVAMSGRRSGDQPPGASQPDAGRRAAGQSAETVLSALEKRREHARARQSAASHRRGHAGAGPLRRAGPRPGDDLRPIATGGTPQQPITSFNYENIGVNIDITPRTHHDDDVTLTLKVAVQSISGAGFGGLPTFANREINTVIRLKDGETNMLAGLIRDDERRVLNGVPGLSDIPVIGRMFAHNRLETTQTDIILTLTPHIIRVLDVKDADLRAFRVGRETISPLSDLPLPVPLPPARLRRGRKNRQPPRPPSRRRW